MQLEVRDCAAGEDAGRGKLSFYGFVAGQVGAALCMTEAKCVCLVRVVVEVGEKQAWKGGGFVRLLEGRWVPRCGL